MSIWCSSLLVANVDGILIRPLPIDTHPDIYLLQLGTDADVKCKIKSNQPINRPMADQLSHVRRRLSREACKRSGSLLSGCPFFLSGWLVCIVMPASSGRHGDCLCNAMLTDWQGGQTRWPIDWCETPLIGSLRTSYITFEWRITHGKCIKGGK